MLCEACKHPSMPTDGLPTPTQTQELRQLLRSRFLPLDKSHYHSQIATSVAALAQYDAKIGRLQHTLEGFLADRSKLQEYADGLQAAMAPVRTLPAEILGEIFAPFSQSEHNDSAVEEPEGLANVELLELSKVCSRWHRVVLGTPRLCHLISEFFRTFLERGAHHPLTISLIIDNGNTLEHEHCVSALTLVAEHSQRWKHMYYRGPLSGLDHISHIKGKLDILETLSLQTWEEETLAELFEIALRLTRVSVHLEYTQLCPKLPWDQLHSFTCIGAHSEEISYITGLMRNLSHLEAAVELRRFNGSKDHLNFPAVTSTISSFLIELWPSVDPDLDEIFDCLTLTHLQKLFIVPVGATKARIPWPVDHFESLSFRSSFCDTLRVLEIPAVDITEDELLSSLASLGSLDRLVVSDQLEFGDLPEHVLITDTLLLRLTHPSHLVPNLKTFMCTSLYQFSADVYFDFAVSRIAAGEGPFQCSLHKFRKTSYEFDPGVHQKLIELVDKGELEFSVGEEEVS